MELERANVAQLLAQANMFVGDTRWTIPAADLADLCRAWLALNDAPEVELVTIRSACADPYFVVRPHDVESEQSMHSIQATHCRLVPLATAKGGQ